jgi:DNA replication protein DnaC
MASADPLASLIDRWMQRASTMPQNAPELAPQAPIGSAVDVRLGWYLPARHKGDTLENYRTVTPSQKIALEAVREWVASAIAGEGGALALVGGVGAGKSHLLYAAVRAVNEAGVHCAAGGWVDLADLFREAKYGHTEDVTAARVKKARILGAAALAIDEIRPTSGTEYDTTELAQLMTRAYREKQAVIVTSNYADDRLARIIGLAATSRLTPVVITGPDLRQPDNRRRYL